jgi:hypothetical protein
MPYEGNAATPRLPLTRTIDSLPGRLGLTLLNFCLLVLLGGAATVLTFGFAFIADAGPERRAHLVHWTLVMIASGSVGAAAAAWVLFQLLGRKRWWWGAQLVPLLVVLLWALFLPADMR